MKLAIKLILLIVSIVVFGLLGFRYFLSFSVADYEGSFVVEGLQSKVDVTFDKKGIPQIWASNDKDMYFTLGYLHASERLFQMELVRRMASGELTEIFGEYGIDSDKRHKQLAFYRKAASEEKQLSDDARNIYDAYVKGINSWVAQATVLPPEFYLLGVDPKVWDVKDCMTILTYQTWYSSLIADLNEDYHELTKVLGENVENHLASYKSWSNVTVSNALIPSIFNRKESPYMMSKASNAWVVSPEKSESNAALMASDPHISVNQIPVLWYVAGLHSNTTHFLGITVPGVPFLAMGRTDKIAFSFTAASVDLVDYQTIPKNAPILKTFTKHTETITPEITVDVFEYPGIRVIDEDSLHYRLVKWAGYDFDMHAMITENAQLLQTETFEEFQKVVTSYGALNANWFYSDIKGNVGYQLGAPIPNRETLEETTGFWASYQNKQFTPHAKNPENGWIANSNNQIVSDQWPYKITGFYDNYRINRLTELLNSKEKLNKTDMTAFQMDNYSGIAKRWKSLFLNAAVNFVGTEELINYENWDLQIENQNEIGREFQAWWHFMAKHLFTDELGDKWYAGQSIIEDVLVKNDQMLFVDNIKTETKETIENISALAFKDAKAFVKERSGSNFREVNFYHPLGMIPGINSLIALDRGPYPVSGDAGSLNAQFSVLNEYTGMFESYVAPSMRFVLDWAEPDAFSLYITTGQSGNPFSPFYDSFIETWRTGKEWQVPLSRQMVYKHKASLLSLLPTE